MNIINNGDDLISVLIPVYNIERYVHECLDSVIKQTYRNIEILIVDDGSTDSTGVICDKYAVVDKRIHVIHKSNEGQAAARNLLLKVAKGEYLVFVDGDDIVTSTYVETLYNLIKKYKCKVSVSILKTFKNGQPFHSEVNKYTESLLTPLEAVEWMNYQVKLDTWPVCKLYHRSIFDSGLRYPMGLIFEDFALTYLLLLESDMVAYCNKCDYFYRLHPESTEGEPFNERKMMGALNVIQSMESHKELLQPIIKSYYCRMLSFAFHLLLPMPEEYEDRAFFIDMIKSYRKYVLFDRKARPKARVAALLSYLGMGVLKLFFRLVDKRK